MTILPALLTLSLLLQPVAAAQSFSDTAGEPQAAAIESLRSAGIVEGYADGTYRPRSPISRAEFLAILLRSEVGDDAIDELLARIRVVNFPDVPTENWSWRYVTYARATGIIAGYPDGTFGPGNNVNIAEAAKIAANVFGLNPVGIQCIRAPCVEAWWSPYVRALDERGALPLDAWSRADRPLTRGEMAELTAVLRGNLTACVRAGCSSQLCVAKSEADDIMTTCEWREEYACYDDARCERQPNGACGWTMTTTLRMCLGQL